MPAAQLLRCNLSQSSESDSAPLCTKLQPTELSFCMQRESGKQRERNFRHSMRASCSETLVSPALLMHYAWCMSAAC